MTKAPQYPPENAVKPPPPPAPPKRRVIREDINLARRGRAWRRGRIINQNKIWLGRNGLTINHTKE